MIRKLKRKFTALATVSMLLLMAVLVLIMNLVNYSTVVRESDAVLDMLSQMDGRPKDASPPPEKPDGQKDGLLPRGMSPEVPYESRYFTVTVNENGEIQESDLSRIISVDSGSVKGYIQKAIAGTKKRGFIGGFRFLRTGGGSRTSIIFLDCGRKLDTFYTFLWISLGVGIFGCVVVFVAFLLASGRIVRPIVESYAKQKRFISDAGHEIKTPLTIINANVDLLECDGEREELREIRNQTARLCELTNSLVYLSKMEEAGQKLPKVPMPLSDIVAEEAETFRTLAAAKHIAFSVHTEPRITGRGVPEAMRRLVCVLLQNAVKYAPDGGIVTLELTRGKKQAVLTVFNTTETVIGEKELPHVFDRFYRADASRNSETGGHGIGLSIAKAIVDEHGGTIRATTERGMDFCVTVTLPL